MWIIQVVRIGAAIVLFLAVLSVPSHTASAAGIVALNMTASSASVVGSWHLDETSGKTAFDSSGNGNDGAISGPVTLGVPGHLNTAYSFVPKGTVIVANASDLVPGTATITISYWLKTTTLPSNGIDYDMFTKGDSSSRGGQIKIEVQENGQASCMFRGSGGGKQLQAGPNVVDGQWHQVTCVRDGTRIVETVDGASFSVTKATGAITVTDPIRLGSHKGGGDWYKGILDEVTYSIGS
jgi:Concanavalin A-like lectin/glucanases superfamily